MIITLTILLPPNVQMSSDNSYTVIDNENHNAFLNLTGLFTKLPPTENQVGQSDLEEGQSRATSPYTCSEYIQAEDLEQTSPKKKPTAQRPCPTCGHV